MTDKNNNKKPDFDEHAQHRSNRHRPPARPGPSTSTTVGSTSLANLGSTERPKRAAASPGVAVAHRFGYECYVQAKGNEVFSVSDGELTSSPCSFRETGCDV